MAEPILEKFTKVCRNFHGNRGIIIAELLWQNYFGNYLAG